MSEKKTCINRDFAISLQQEIERLCEKHNVFCSVTHDKKPYLAMIKMEVSIKIEPEHSNGNGLTKKE
jgi:hypothetical protein